MSRLCWRGVVAFFIMKAINQYITYEYQFYNSNVYHKVNGTCQVKYPAKSDTVDNNSMMYTIHFGYTLSVVGGLMANSRIGFRPVLSCGGAVTALAASLLASSISLGLVCNPAFYAFVWMLHPLYMGLISPCLFYGFVRLSCGRKSRMVLASLYYCSSEVFTWLEVIVSPILTSNWNSYLSISIAGACLGLVFLSLSTTQEDEEQSSVEVPTMKRLVRWFRILTSFTLFAIQLYDSHINGYQQEVLLYSKNSTNNSPAESSLLAEMSKRNFPRYVNMAAVLGTCLFLVLHGLSRRTSFVSHELRIQIGITTAATVALVCFAADLLLANLGPASPILTTAIFCSASFLDGASEILAMVAVYEFIDIISTRDHKLMLFGVAFSIWTLAYFARYSIRRFTFDVVMPVITSDMSYKHCVNHALNFVLLVICLAYTRRVAFPLAYPLVHVDPIDQPDIEEEDEADTERTSLTSPTYEVAASRLF